MFGLTVTTGGNMRKNNALYNLAQVSFETNAQDQTVKDDQPPKLAKVKQTTTDNPINITFEVTS